MIESRTCVPVSALSFLLNVGIKKIVPASAPTCNYTRSSAAIDLLCMFAIPWANEYLLFSFVVEIQDSKVNRFCFLLSLRWKTRMSFALLEWKGWRETRSLGVVATLYFPLTSLTCPETELHSSLQGVGFWWSEYRRAVAWRSHPWSCPENKACCWDLRIQGVSHQRKSLPSVIFEVIKVSVT